MILVIDRNQKPYFHGSKVVHNYWTLSITCSGTGIRKVGNKSFPLKPGTLICIPPNAVHQSLSENGMMDIVIYTTSFSLEKKTGNQPLMFQDDDTHTARTLFELMCRIFQKYNAFLGDFVEDLYTNLETFFESCYAQQQCDPRISRITAHFNANFPDAALSVERILKSEGHCIDYIRRLFKKTHGCTPVEYVTRLRIDRAKKLLEGNCLRHYSISEIAGLSGFEDVSYFSRVFRKQMGLSPTEYEKQFLIIDLD